ncbi:MAG: S8 family serine peptidase [Candidatus Eremiobacteraeota bacterium]|nr:S8 family serine peptidase [Candidatus Eremiobacteraeota bacterium]
MQGLPGDSMQGLPGDTATGMPGDSMQGLPGDSMQGLPGDSMQGLPGDSMQGLPGDSMQGLPGESMQGLPGALFGCPGVPAAGSAKCTVAINTNAAPVADPNLSPALIAGFHPADLQAAYGLPAQNAGQVVAIVDAFDSPTAESDLAVYRAAFGLPPCTTSNGCFRKVDQHGGSAYPAANPGWAEEIALDLDMVSAACPRCSILLVESNSALMDDLGAGVDTAVGLGAKIVSNSYYAPEWSGESAEEVHYRHPGVALTASSGDRGYPSYPATSAWVTAVGGTSLTRSGGSFSESAWKYAGHGCSTQIRRPTWQSVPCQMRSGVDVAAVADPQTGVSMFNAPAGGWLVVGGTSVGAPLIAGAYALSGTPAGPWYSYSYARRGSFHPLTTNGRYTYATGLGSPNGVGGL